jgi:hypothetical protein
VSASSVVFDINKRLKKIPIRVVIKIFIVSDLGNKTLFLQKCFRMMTIKLEIPIII